MSEIILTNKKLKIILKNSFCYQGLCLNATEKEITINDRYAGTIILNRASVEKIEILGGS